VKLVRNLVLTLVVVAALNFIAVTGAVGWLFSSGKLDKDKLAEIGKIVFPEPASQPAKQDDSVDPATTQPMMRFDELLSATQGRSTTQQLEFMRDAFDKQMALLSRQRTELIDLKRQIEMGRSEVSKQIAAVEAREKAVEAREKAITTQAQDKGFADALKLYKNMPSKQVKDLFIAMDDKTVVRFLQAMDARQASRVLKEFKTPVELSRAQTLLEMMRKSDATAESGTSPAN
jgi:hypothetical protein